MPEPHYPDHLTEGLKVELEATRKRLAICEARLRDETSEKDRLAIENSRLRAEVKEWTERVDRFMDRTVSEVRRSDEHIH
jgi:FtsZ-binding cell division protein ZapB